MSDWDQHNAIDKVLDVDCPGCGSKLFYSAEHGQISCGHCGYREDIIRENDQIVENSLEDALKGLSYYVPESESRKVYDCKSCGAKFILDAEQTRVNCGFCGSENVNLEAYEHRYVQPAGILPFQVDRRKSEEVFRAWVRKGWFHPGKLKTLASIQALHGVYVPFWTFDAQTESDWQGEAGYYYYETVRVKVGDNWQTKQVQKIRWVWKSGHLSHFFDDLVVSASGNLQQAFLDRILPYKLEEMVNFDGRLMVGWESEVYNVEVDQGWQRADTMMDERIRMMCTQAMGGDTQRNLAVRTAKSAQTFKHVVLPVWLCSYRYQDKIYRFVINGQTGKVYGEKPIAWWKIVLLVGLFALVIFGIYWMRESGIFAGG